MWLLVFVGVAQGAIIAERVLNRVVLLVVPTQRTETKKLSDRFVLSAFASQLLAAITTLLSVGLIVLDTLLRNVFLVTGVVAVMIALTVLADNNSFMYVLLYNTYNSGVGYLLHFLVVGPIKLLHNFFGVLLPLWNAVTWFAGRILLYIVVPVLQASPGEIPVLLENLSLCAASLSFSLYNLADSVMRCVIWDAAVDGQGLLSFAEENMQCIANSNFITLDLMTPGLYMRGALGSALAVVAGSCSVVSPLLEVLSHPVLDYHFYRAIHCAVHAVVHTVVALPVMTYHRCEYGRRHDKFDATEKTVMCMPDWTPLANIVSAGSRSLGLLLDNWLNVVLVVVEKNVGIETTVCDTAPTLGAVWARVSEQVGLSARLRVVGLTSVMYAITDGVNTAYHTLTDGTQLQFALHHWPFVVDTRFGIAAVQYADVQDADEAGSESTGMFGCACMDSAAGMVLSCASVPYQVLTTDSAEAYARSTVHPVSFEAPYAATVMRCAHVRIQVVSLRFSRRRYSQAVRGVETAFNDVFDTNSAARTRLTNTADAAVYVHPQCRVSGLGTEEMCLPDTAANCYPWCMGLHIAGRKNQQIVLQNQVAWENSVNLAQTECVIGADDRQCVSTAGAAKPSASSRVFNESMLGVCDFALSRCESDDNWNTQQPSPAEQRVMYSGPRASLRLEAQPFVAAGDIFLYEHSDADGAKWLVVARLSSSGSSEFSVQHDRLSMNSNALRRRIYGGGDDCALPSNDACYRNAVRRDEVVLPSSYGFWSQPHNTVAVSEWAVHWTDEPDLSLLSCVWQACHAIRSTCLEVTSSFRRARVWSMKAVRASHTMGVETKEDPSVSFMTVPDFIRSTTKCHETVNFMVVGVEYLNRNNLLLTTKATSPNNFWEGVVLDESKCVYRYYFIHPNRADCLDVTDDNDGDGERLYSCWRDESVGMFGDETVVNDQAPVRSCPAMQRMPQLGSAGAELAVATVLVLRLVAHMVFVLPAAASSGGVFQVFGTRDHYTHHSVLDTDGNLLLDVESIVYAMEMSAHYMWGSLAKISEMLRGRPGHHVLEGVLIGTARVMEHTAGAQPLAGVALRIFDSFTASTGPVKAVLAESALAATSSPFHTMPAPVQSLRRMFLTSARSGQMAAKMTKRLLLKVLKAQSAAALLNSALVTTTLFEAQHDLRDGWLDNMRAQCDGLAQIVGSTSPWARVLKHACLLGPDSIDGFVQAFLALTVSYPVMHCVCKLPEGGDAGSVIEDVCLRQLIPIAFSAWSKSLIVRGLDTRQSMCFQSMDAANRQLQDAFDPFLSRLFKLTQAVEASVDYLTVSFQQDGGKCEDVYGSAYVVTVMPEPVDYFMQCMHTFDCRARCLDTHSAFDRALAEVANPPVFEHTTEVLVQNRLFSVDDIDNNRHLPPFTVKRIQELPTLTCETVICRNTRNARFSSCLAAVGIDSANNLAIAYYCVPGDISQFVFAHQELPFVNGAASYAAVPAGTDRLSDVFLLTTAEVRRQQREILLTVSVSSEEVWHVYAYKPEERTRFQIFASTKWDVEQFDRSLSDAEQPMYSIDKAWVINADDAAYVYVGGQRMVPATLASAASSFMRMPAFDTYDSQASCVLLRVPFVDGALDLDRVERSDCGPYREVVLPDEHTNVCVYEGGEHSCQHIIAIPLQSSEVAEVRVTAFNASELASAPLDAAQWSTELLPGKTRRGKSIASALQMDDRSPLYLTQFGAAAEKRRHTSSTSFSNLTEVRAFVTGDPRQAWLQVVSLSRSGDEYHGGRTTATEKTASVNLVVACSLDNCVGCMPNMQRGVETVQFANLQSKCMAAQECSIVRCVGSTVNMRKPLCNMGKVLGVALDVARVGVGAVWLSLTRSIIITVELSQRRRKQYELDWPQESLNAAICNTKDGLVETVATVTSIVGFATWVADMELNPDSGSRSAKVDTRFHAHSIIVLTALTNFITALSTWPLYVVLSLEKTLTCAGNDLMLAVDNADQDGEPLFLFGSKSGNAAAGRAVGICLSEQMGSTMRDISTRSAAAENEAAMVIEQMQEAIMLVPFEPFQHALDGFLSYLIGIVSGLIDVLQASDMKHCKLRVVGKAGLWQCVCGDVAAVIPPQLRADKTSAYWCTGPLLLNKRSGEDILVWNPYSLEELLGLGQYEVFLRCLDEDTGCEAPNVQIFAEQGVELLQVVNRCRSNFQLKQWDEGALFLGLFSEKEWAGRLRDTTAADVDGNQFMAREKLRLLQIWKSWWSPPEASISRCYRLAIVAGERTPACMEAHLRSRAVVASGTEEYFLYEDSTQPTFAGTDACRSFSGSGALSAKYSAVGSVMPLFMWSSASRNVDPVASLHLVAGTGPEQLVRDAEASLAKMFDEEIAPYFSQNRAVSEDISVRAWSVEGDELHQFVDCVILGPYAAADLHTSFTMTNGRQFPVEQYHRHSPDSRDFAASMETGGSPFRRSLMQSVQDAVSHEAQQAVVKQAQYAMNSLRNYFANPANLRCPCEDESQANSVLCCREAKWTSAGQITFPANQALNKEWDIQAEVVADIIGEISSSKLLSNRAWTDSSFYSAPAQPVSQEDAFELHRMYLFDPGKVVREYSQNEVLASTGGGALWDQCMFLLSSAFFTMPVRADSTQVDADMRYDPTQPADSYLHGMEAVVRQMLHRARAESPVYWTHVHRYMPSDSMWCEGRDAPPTPTAPSSDEFRAPDFHGIVFDDDKLRTPRLAEVPSVADLRARCFCGWRHGDTCRVHAAVDCAAVALLVAHADTRAAWLAICALPERAYSTSEALFVVMDAMNSAAAATPDCEDMQASTVWGAMGRSQQKRWWEGATAGPDLQELATLGPAGLRLGLLGNGPNSLHSHVTAQQLAMNTSRSVNYRLRHTIAQPYCEGSKEAFLDQDIRGYFKDVLFPMAHTVHESSAGAFCSTWAIELAILDALQEMNASASLIESQVPVAQIWRERCNAQLQQIGICHLRGVYAIKPSDGRADSAKHCAFALSDVSATVHCADLFYVTPNCLVMCDGDFYDPCVATQGDCASVVFARQASAKILVDARHYSSQDDVQLFSMHWPSQIALREAVDSSQLQQQRLQQVLRDIEQHDGFFDAPGLHQLVRDMLVARETREEDELAEGSAPEAFCDDLLDYFDADAQHPVGYHPTSACSQDETYTRGFDTWMSADEDGTTQVDPTRLRNMTAFSSLLGHSHVLCDGAIYGQPARTLNPFFLQSRWDANAKADPFVPVATVFPPESMQQHGVNTAEDAFDTPLVSSFPDGFRHSLGLLRGWLLGSELSATWPQWNVSETDAYGSNVSAYDEACAMPAQLTCRTDLECGSAGDRQLACQLNPDGVGVCGARLVGSKRTCFAHSHCLDNTLCSGEGLCEPAQLSVQNRLDAPVNWQIFAGPCEVDSYGLTEFEGVGDFAAANGMCGAVNRFTYSAIVQRGSPVSEQGRGGETAVATKVSNMDFQRPGPDTEPHSLLQAGVLRAQPHPCDMSYQHTDYKVCTAEHVGAVTDYDDASAASEHDMMWAIRTWQKQDDEESVTFCSIGENSGVEGFLSPYRYYPGDGAAPQNTLRHVADTVLPCSRFQMCPQVNFKVGNFVFARRIMTASGQRGQNTLAFGTPVRSYSNRDSDHCFGAGYRVSDKGADEAGGDAPGYLARCIVDRWVLPLLSVAFMGDDTSDFLPAYTFCSADTPMFCPAGLRSRFDALRAQCPRAFGVDAGENSFANFVMHFEKLSRDYAVEEAGSVLAHANSLLPWMFGIEHSQVSYRGFVSVAEYASHVQCATYLIDRMHQISEANPVRNEYMTDGGASKAVGLSLYMFHERAAIYIPFRWFWQCVVTATHTEGGAQADWYLIMTAPDDSHSSILCENYAYQASNAQMTLKRLFQTSEHLFDTAPSYVARDSELENDVVRTTTMALLELKLPSVPNLETVNFAEDEDNEHDVVMFPTVAEYESSKKLFSKDRTRQLGAVGRITKPIHDDVVQWLFAQESTAYPTTSVSDQILGQHLQERTLDTLVQDTESNIPRYSFARLSATPGLITSLPAVRYYKRNKDFIVDSAGVEQGATAYATRIENGGYQLAAAEFGMMLGSPLDAALYPKTLNLAAADDRDSFLQGRVYFTRQQVTYMVLRYLRIHLPFGGYMAGETYGKTDNVRVQAAMNDDTDVSTPFDLSSYKLYNNEMRRKSFECHEFETILYDAETNFAFVQLRQCQLALQKPVGWAVRAGQHLRFSVSKDVMLAGFYCAFSERGSRGEFLHNLTAKEWATSERRSGNHNSKCFYGTDKPELLNPFLPGSYDEEIGCETRHLEGDLWSVAGMCDTVCAQNFPAWHDTTQREFPSACAEHDNEVRSRRDVHVKPGLTGPCALKFEPEGTCTLRHGTLAGNRGAPVADLYAAGRATPHETGLWSPANFVVRGPPGPFSDNALTSTLRLKASDIAGHAVVFDITPVGLLTVTHLPMGVAPAAPFVGPGRKVADWMLNIEQTWLGFHSTYHHSQVRDSTLNARVAWTCPLQRLAAHYNTSRMPYAMRTPSAKRNQVRFAHITGVDARFAHPTVRRHERVRYLSPGRFMSEFIACTAQDRSECQSAGLRTQTLASLRSADWQDVGWVEGSQGPCTHVLDWPMQTADMVDGSIYAGVESESEWCNVYGRLPSFQLRLARSLPKPPEPTSSVQGVCRMGRLRRIRPTAQPGSFSLQHCSQSEHSLACAVLRADGTPGQVEFAAPRPEQPTVLPPRRRNRRCGHCDRAASTRFVENDASSSSFAPEEPLLSVGVPIKLSTARLMAAHIRRAVCGSSPTCPQLDVLLGFSGETWSKSRFLERMLLVEPASLPPPAPPDAELWARPWVWCNETRCRGSISKDAWRQPSAREGLCAAAISANAAASALPVHFCEIDAHTAATCRKVKEWQNRASGIICRALGFAQCQQSDWFYSPTRYSSSNGEFVHDTVQTFYQDIAPGACAVGASALQAAQIASNEQLMGKCAAMAMVPVKEILVILRTIKSLVIELMYYATQTGMQLVWMLAGLFTMQMQIIERAGDMMMKYIGQLFLKVAAILSQLARMVFQVVFGQGTPKAIVKIVQFLCKAMNWIKRYIIGTAKWNGVMCVIVNYIATICEFVASLLKVFMKISILGFRPFEYILFVHWNLFNGLAKIFANLLPCSEEGMQTCDFDELFEEEVREGTLPSATRCFSTYGTFFGDSTPLSCTAADTCVRSLVDRSLVVCGSCDTVPVTTRFACSPITKTCQCNVPKRETTLCSANADCYTDASCSWISDDYDASFGSIPCSLCTDSKMCFMQAGHASGYCACSLHPVVFATCTAAQVGQTPMLPYDSMCLHTNDVRFRSSSGFRLAYDQLVAVPCGDVNPAFAFCVAVSVSSAETRHLVVSSAITGARSRHLLAHAELAGNTTHNVLCKDALDGGSLPATRLACVETYRYSVQTVRLLGMSEVLPECMFCSVDDFMHAVLENPLLIPVLGAHPARLAHVLGRHTPLRHVLRALDALRATVRVLAMDVHVNDTSKVLVDLARFLDNRTAARSLLSLAESRPMSALSDAFAAQGAAFGARFDEMKRVQRAYAQTLSALLAYEPDSTYASSLWDDSVVRPLGSRSPDACTPLVDMVRLAKEASTSTKAYFTQKPPQLPLGGLRDAWPSFRRSSTASQQQALWDPTLDSITASAIWVVRAGMAVLRIDTANVRGFVESFVGSARDALKCDLLQVQTCSAWKVRLLDGLVVVLCYALLVYFVMSALGLSLLAVLLWPVIPLAVLYLCYGYSPACVPLVPTCFLLDLYTSLELLLPKRLVIPYTLFRQGVSSEGIARCQSLLTMECLTSCSRPPFEYQDWKWVLAWGAAEVGPSLYRPLETMLVATGFADELPVRILQKENVLLISDDATVYANRICAFVSLYKLIPLLFASFMALGTVFALTRLLLSVVFALVLLVNSVLISVFTQ